METTSKQARAPVKRPMLAILGVLVGAFVGMFSETSLNIALPQLIYALNISTASAQWLVTGYMLVIGIVLPFSSLLTKWFSTRQLVIFGLSDFSIGASLVMIDFAIILSAMYLLPQYIQNGLLISVALTGIIMLPGGIVNAIVSAIAGRLYDKNGAKTPVQIGFTLALIGAVMLAFTSTTSSIGYVILAHVILMIGCPLAMSPAQTHVLNALNGTQAADGSTIMNTLQQIVGAVATALATLLLTFGESIDPGAKAATAFTTGVHYGIYFTIALIILGLFRLVCVKKDNHQKWRSQYF